MTLATILLVLWVSTSGGLRQATDDAQPPAPAPQTQNPSPPRGPSDTAQPPPANTKAGAQSSTAVKPPKHKKNNHKGKKTADANCTPAPQGSAQSVSPAADSAQPGSAQSSSPPAPNPCPPPKIVVRDGGADEPAIELTGDTAASASERATTDQLLAATEENLKKIASMQLSSNQQEVVTQIRQYMQQAKAAVTAGDLQRGRNLATKAHLLSEDLAKK